ncbi:MAG: multicopper oxidase domain-containing protein, partial [Chitinophagales bacterium]
SCKKMEDGMEEMMPGEPVPVTEGNFSDALNFPVIQSDNYSLIAQTTNGGVFNSNPVAAYGYQNDALLGPTLKVSSGQPLSVNVQNNLVEPTNIHWHGLTTPENMDGYPTDLIQAGSSFNYNFPVNSRAGMYWYHPHSDKKTGEHTFKGLAGLIIVNDAEESALNLPSGQQELLLVIQDKRISGNTINYAPAETEVITGYMGTYVFVNGVYAPFYSLSTRQYRVRILNGSNARVYHLALSDTASFTVIGSDGGLMATPETVNSILVGPGERVDLIVDFRNYALNSEVFLISKTFDGGIAQGTQEFKIMKFVVSQQEADTFILPAALSSYNVLSESQSTHSRSFDISNPHGTMGHSGHESGMGHNIGGKTFDANRIDEYVTAGAIEVWTFDNSLGEEPHPMHLHGVQFQLLDRAGGRGVIEPWEKGWKDTALLMPKEKVQVIIPFGSSTGKFVFHCHNLEHEDDGMMLNYLIQ